MTTKTSQDHTSLQMRIAAMIMGSTLVPHPQLDNARRIAGVILKLIEEDETVATIQSEDDGGDSANAAERHAKPILDECGCTYYVGKEPCRHSRIYDDRMRSFLAGVRWARNGIE